jgi:hypothetical protein
LLSILQNFPSKAITHIVSFVLIGLKSDIRHSNIEVIIITKDEGDKIFEFMDKALEKPSSETAYIEVSFTLDEENAPITEDVTPLKSSYHRLLRIILSLSISGSAAQTPQSLPIEFWKIPSQFSIFSEIPSFSLLDMSCGNATAARRINSAKSTRTASLEEDTVILKLSVI